MISAVFAKKDAVYRAMEGQILSGHFPIGSRLPGIRKLARAFDVSYRTVCLAAEALERNGLLRRRHGSGLFVAKGPSPPREKASPPMKASRNRSGQIADQICEEISSGNLGVGEPLPLKKSLCYQYKTSLQSLNLALAEVEGKGLIHKRGSAFIVGPERTRRQFHRNRVTIVPARNPSGDVAWGSRLEGIFQIAFDKELSNFGISLSRHHQTRDGMPLITAKPDTGVLGFICPMGGEPWLQSLTDGDQKVLVKEMARLNKLGRRVVIFNCGLMLRRFPEFNARNFRSLYLLGSGGIDIGMETALYLTMKGHKQIAFFSYSEDRWVKDHLSGVNQGLRQAADENASVVEFGARVDKRALWNTSPGVGKRRRNDLRSLIASWYPDIEFDDRINTDRFIGTIHGYITNDHHRVAMRPLFENALADKSVSAWVCADATVAHHANQFLAENEIPVPKQLSLICIGDHQLLSRQGTSACDQGLDRMGYLAAHCLLGDIPIKKNKRGAVACPPRIIERGTVGRL